MKVRILWGFLPQKNMYMCISSWPSAIYTWKEVSNTGKASQEKSAYTKKFLFPTSIPPFRNTAHIQAIGVLSYLFRPKRLKVKMKGKCYDCVRWQVVDLIWCFANRLHPLLSACPLRSTVPDKKRQLVFFLDFINDHKEHDLANHVIFCIGINSLSQIILPFPCLSRK